jgi:hypothetical protein
MIEGLGQLPLPPAPGARPVEPPDSHHLSSAIGWLELGNHLEANLDLQKIKPLLRTHPDVMEVRWRIYAKAKWWEACVDLSNALVRLAPERSSGWIYRAYGLRRTKGLLAAWMSLLPGAEKFQNEWLIAYHLACYSCQLGNLDGARKWLAVAVQKGDKQQVKKQALADQDLKALWPEIRDL